MKKSLSIEEFLETRPDITPEMLEEGRLLVEAKIKGYELQQARKACGMTQKEVARQDGRQPEAHLRPGERQHRRMQVETLRRYITSLGGTLEITAKLPGVSLELQGLGTIIRSSSKRRAPWRRTDGGDRLDQRRSLAIPLRCGTALVWQCRSLRIYRHSLPFCCVYTTCRYNKDRDERTADRNGQVFGSTRGIPSKNSESVMSNPFAIFARFCRVTLRCPTSMEPDRCGPCRFCWRTALG